MVRYFYAWMPVVVVFGTAVILICPYLAVIVLAAVVLGLLGALAALVWTTAWHLYAFAHSALGHPAPPAARQRADTGPRVALTHGRLGAGASRRGAARHAA